MVTTLSPAPAKSSTGRIYVVRSMAAIAWAAAMAIALSASDALRSHEALPALLATLVVAYPAIDLVATFVEARTSRLGESVSRSPQLVNAAISAVTAVAIGVAASHGTAATLRVFGTWAVLTGVIQLILGIVRRRSGNLGQLPMILSGGISVLAGATFVQMAGQDEPKLGNVVGYAILGAVFFLISARRGDKAQPTAA